MDIDSQLTCAVEMENVSKVIGVLMLQYQPLMLDLR